MRIRLLSPQVAASPWTGVRSHRLATSKEGTMRPGLFAIDTAAPARVNGDPENGSLLTS